MEVTIGAFVTCFLTVLILTVYIYFIIYIKIDILYDGMKFAFVAIALILIRMMIPFNFPFTVTIVSHKVLPPVSRLLFNCIGDTEIRPVYIVGDIWITGTLIKLAHLCINQWRYRNYLQPFIVKDWSKYPDLKEILSEYDVPSLEVCIVPAQISPAIFGLWSPILILPDMKYTRNELYYICRHEMEHYRNHDLWLKLFIDLVICIQWFNPIVYIMDRGLTLAFELSNDNEILKDSDEVQRMEYAECVVKAARFQKSKANNKRALSFVAFTKPNIVTRIQYIYSDKYSDSKKKSISVILRYIVVGLMLVASFVFVPEAYRIDEPVKSETVGIYDGNAYILSIDGEYQLFVDDEYMFSLSPIPEEFSNLPIIEEEK